MSDRPPKFTFKPRVQAFGKLDISHELIICSVTSDGRLQWQSHPKSYEDAVLSIGTPASRKTMIDLYGAERRAYDEYRVAYQAWRTANDMPEEPPYMRDTRSAEGRRQWADYDAKLATVPAPPGRVHPPWRTPVGDPTLLLALNAARDAYEIVLDPHDLGGLVDPMMLLNFRRKV